MYCENNFSKDKPSLELTGHQKGIASENPAKGNHPFLGKTKIVHSFQPYFNISHLANKCIDQNIAPLIKPIYNEVERLILLSKKEAEAEFHRSYEYKEVTYGCNHSQEGNYGIFAKRQLEKHKVIGIYSGTAYVTEYNNLPCNGQYKSHESSLTDLTTVLPDYLSAYRTMMSNLAGKADSNYRTPHKYLMRLTCKKETNAKILIMPDNDKYTPMHFINSAKNPDNVNIDYLTTLINGIDQAYPVSFCLANRDINAGEELMGNYLVDITENEKKLWSLTVKQEREIIENIHLSTLNNVRQVSKSSGVPISTFVHAPVYNVTKEVRKSSRVKNLPA